TVLVEGSAFQLDPELLNFFPKDQALTRKVNDALTKQAIVKGSELYLLESKGAKGYGVEDLRAYRENGVAFVDVLTQKEKTSNFLADMNMQIERLASHSLSKELRDFLRRVEGFEKNQIPLDTWLADLKGEAKKRLEIDLASPAYQLDWPMMVRLFKMQELTAKLDKQKFLKERDEFLKALRRFSPDGEKRTKDGASSFSPSAIHHPSPYAQVEVLLKSETQSQQLPDPETGLLFEAMVKQLPENFNYDAFPNVRSFVGSLLLQSELKADRLMPEIQKLTDAISQKLTRSKEEKQLIALLADHRLLQKLFALELTPEDYETIGSRMLDDGGSLKPSSIVNRFENAILHPSSSIPRVKTVPFSHLSDLDTLFDKAMKFYAGVKERDTFMMQRVEARLKETGARQVAIITGGFHSEPFHQYFTRHQYTYALISPRLTGADEQGHAAYIENALQSAQRAAHNAQREVPGKFSLSVERSALSAKEATRESVSPADRQVLAPENPYGINQTAMRVEVRRVVSEVAGRTPPAVEEKIK
ncbi:MAG: hypothetical protein HY767_02240, partial [Candidatus Omnitrophica bacterium]|nr:hypothetical protein [Candidatus Omnitrophota bacterium]